MIKTFYDKFLLAHPVVAIVLLLLLLSVLFYNANGLQIDASSETLLIKEDKDLKFLNQTDKTFDNKNFLVISYSPKGDLFDKQSLDTIEKLSGDLLKLKHIQSITSILNVPLLQSPIMPVSKLVDNIPSLKDKNVDLTLAKSEFMNSPFYKNNLVSKDLCTTAIVLTIEDGIDRDENHLLIKKIREILNSYQENGELYLGGVNMISDDMIEFIKTDLMLYGSILMVLMIMVLWTIFREKRWIVISVFISFLSIVGSISMLGLFDWKVTVISSNFISLQLIITISIVLHLIVRYRELLKSHESLDQKELILRTVLSKIGPSFFAILTTIVGFGSLILSEILPVINLGWMMSSSILISLFIAFIFFPAFLSLLPKSKPYVKFEENFRFTKILANVVQKYPTLIVVVTLIIVMFSVSGAFRLEVENSFVSYFKKDTEIYKGLKKIDTSLGGTTPLDVVITFKDDEKVLLEDVKQDEFDEFEDEFEDSKDDAQYWFTTSKMEMIEKIHDYLEQNRYIGNVQSLASILKVGRVLNNGKNLDTFELALLYNKMPLKFKKIILLPYLNIEKNQIRFSTRVIDTDPTLRRDALLKQIDSDLKVMLENENVEYRVSNLMVLYNNMLQSLFSSQILTLGFVVLLLFAMFLLIFQSLYISFAAIVANIIPIGTIFGLMGWFGIPLDMMSITIAAIGLGIGVDDTIHYIYRYKKELQKSSDPFIAMHNSHESIGLAMYYTTLVISLGFFVLIFSNFIPTIYFGILTVVVMIMALLGSLVLLPKLLIYFYQKGYRW